MCATVEPLPDGTFKLASVTDSALNIQCDMSLEYHVNVTTLFRKFVTIASLKVPSGYPKKSIVECFASLLKKKHVTCIVGFDCSRSRTTVPFSLIPSLRFSLLLSK